MPFRLSVYRAPDGIGPMHEWEEEHREELGTRREVQEEIGRTFPHLRWDETDGMAFASFSPEDDPARGFEISVFGAPGDVVNEVWIHSFPPNVRALMSGLRLNHCYAAESGDMYFPFEAGDRWQ